MPSPNKDRLSPREVLSTGSKASESAARVRDQFLEGDPASWRTPMIARAFYPELQNDGFYSNSGSTLHALYEEMMAKDGPIYGLIEQRRAAVLSKSRRIVPASSEAMDTYVADFVESALNNISGDDGGFDGDLYNLLYGIATGHSICEIEWGTVSDLRVKAEATPEGDLNAKGRDWVLPVAIRHRYPGAFVFDKTGALFHAGAFTSTTPIPVADRKFLILRFGGAYENPYGCGLLQRVWWYYRFKKECQVNWSIGLSKYGSPTAVAKYPPGATPEQRATIETVLQRIATDTGVQIPEGFSLELLEAGKQGVTGDPFRSLMEYCDDCMARAIVGSTLTSGEGRRSGSLALGKVHADVAADKIEQDSRILMWVIRRRLIRWIVDFNFGPDVDTPLWIIDTDEEGSALGDLDIDQRLLAMGLPLSREYFYKRYLRSMPDDDDPSLQTDKPAILPEHMLYGIITINEARVRLGLPPVPWGDAPVKTPSAPSPFPPPTSTTEPDESATAGDREETGSGDVEDVEKNAKAGSGLPKEEFTEDTDWKAMILGLVKGD